jgi:hypothetical protein
MTHSHTSRARQLWHALVAGRQPGPDSQDTTQPSNGEQISVPTLTDVEEKSLTEILHPSLPEGSTIYGATKVFPDYQAEPGEMWTR